MCLVLSVLVCVLAGALWRTARRRRRWPESATQFRALFEEAPVAYQEIDRHGIVRRVNRAACELLGYPPSELVGKGAWEVAPPQLRASLRAELMGLLAGSSDVPTFTEHQTNAADGSPLTLRIYIRLIRDEKTREVIGLRAALLDATAWRNAERELERSEERYRNLFENAPIGVYRTAPDGRILIANPALVRLLGYDSFEHLAARNLECEGFEPDYRRADFKAQLERDGEILGHEATWTTRNGRSVAIRENARAVRDPDGAVLYYEGTVEDVTEPKRVEAALAEARSKLETVIRQSPLAVVTLDAAGDITSWNPGAERLFGWAEAEVLGARPPVALGSASNGRERQALRKDGSVVDVNVWHALLHDAAGQVSGAVCLVADNTERRQAEARLSESERRYRDLFENANDIVLSLDLEGRFTAVNKTAQQVSGYSRDEMLALKMTDLVAPEDVGRMREIVSGMLAGVPSGQYDLKAVAKDGRRLELEITSRLIFENGRPLGFQSIARDVTGRKESERRLEQYARALSRKNDELSEALETARQATEAKSRFLANMSHEIRTPMNGVLGMTELLLETDLDPSQRDCAAAVKKSAEAMLVLINEILDLSRIEAGKLELHPEPFDLGKLVAWIASMLEVQARPKGVAFRCTMDDAVPRMLSGDPVRFRQVLDNLAANAVKFTERGHVAVNVGVEAETADVVTVRCTVEDTGIGITADQMPRLFHSFSQADSSTTKRYGGAGLGLSISKQLVEMMGGHIGCESKPGEGSRFWFTATLAKALDAPLAAEPAPEPRARSSAGGRILLAEDNEINRRIALRLLERAGYRASAVENGKLAVAEVLAGAFDAVLMDVHMPEMDGFEATAEIRRVENGSRHTPVIALTARAMTGDRERCIQAGMDDYLTKPVRRDELLAVLDRWVPPQIPSASSGSAAAGGAG
ncbi:MAG TPA: PAS domain S-box protein [Bryobacteraceae bacterium]|nr:PAS domain S-box protein [Bryobacteraceae bacterium]